MRGLQYIAFIVFIFLLIDNSSSSSEVIVYPNGQCVDHASIHLGMMCDDVVKWTFWVPSPNITAQHSSSVAAVISYRRELVCALLYPKCNDRGHPMPICEFDCLNWQGICTRQLHSTNDKDCTPLVRVKVSNSVTKVVGSIPVICILLFLSISI